MSLALVTGASSGIGRSLALLLAGRGVDVAITGRNNEALRRLASEIKRQHKVRAAGFACDLGRPDGPKELTSWLDSEEMRPDILVNNAGFGTYGFFSEQTVESQVEMIQVNITSVVELTHRLLPAMLANRNGRILNVASTAAFQPGPLMAVYYASKAFVLHFSEALNNELDGTGVTATALCPGPTATAFQDRANLHKARLVKSAPMMDADTVAKQGIEGLFAGRSLVIPGLLNQATAFSTRFAPRWLTTKMARFVQESD